METGVLCEEAFHFIVTTRKDNNNVGTVIFHLLHDGVDRFVSIQTVTVIHKRVRLINKKLATYCFFKTCLNRLRSPTNILSNQIPRPTSTRSPRGAETPRLSYASRFLSVRDLLKLALDVRVSDNFVHCFHFKHLFSLVYAIIIAFLMYAKRDLTKIAEHILVTSLFLIRKHAIIYLTKF